MVDNSSGDPGNAREGEPTAVLTFPSGLQQLGGDRTQQPGQLEGQWQQGGSHPRQERKLDPFSVLSEASDKFGIQTLFADQSKAYQILPADYQRRTAVIMCMSSAVYLGDETSVGNAAGVVYTPTTIPPNVFVLAPSIIASSAVIALQFTSKQGLYVCSASATVAQVQSISERFDSGVPIR